MGRTSAVHPTDSVSSIVARKGRSYSSRSLTSRTAPLTELAHIHETEDWRAALLGSPARYKSRRCCVFYSGSVVRKAWEVLISVLLLYIATIFLYNLAFVSLRPEWDRSWWHSLDKVVNVIFVVDLIVMFFFTYRNSLHEEVDDLCMIAKHYLRTTFVINLLTCIPEPVLTWLLDDVLLNVVVRDDIHQTARIFRLQRVARLGRMLRLTRLFGARQYRESGWWQWLQSMTGVRLVNVTLCLCLFVHVLACGWYLCASFHDKDSYTWLVRRFVDSDGLVPVSDAKPFIQWMHSVYFVLETLTTVGYGDMYAVTNVEMMYACVLMASGTVIHGIIISQVTACFANLDAKAEFVSQKLKLIDRFADHTNLNETVYDGLRSLVASRAKEWYSSLGNKFDKEAMEEFIKGADMPRRILESLPRGIQQGQLLKNSIFAPFMRSKQVMPPRLPCLIALKAQNSIFLAGELVYQAMDISYHLFLVSRGTFGFIAVPTEDGGITFCPGHTVSIDDDSSSDMAFPFHLFPVGTYFGDTDLLLRPDRAATVRCESEEAIVTALHRTDVQELSRDFLHFGLLLKAAAYPRARNFKKKQDSLKIGGRKYEELAALVLQRFARAWAERKKRAASKQFAGIHEEDNGNALERAKTCRDLALRIGQLGKQAWHFKGQAQHGQDNTGVAASVTALRNDMDKLSGEVGQLGQKVLELQTSIDSQVSDLQSTMSAVLEEVRRKNSIQRPPSAC